MAGMMHFLREFRAGFYAFSSYQIFGYQIDTGLHLVVGFLMLLLLRRYFSMKKSLYISFGLIFLKELVDLFAKSRVEYVRPPHLDAMYDILAGTVGVLGAWWFLRRRERRNSASKKTL